GDFFTIVDRILHTYGEGSAYVELSNWFGRPCHDCATVVADDDASSCQACEERLCGDCIMSCGGCSDGYCAGCLDRCGQCDELTCSGCLTRCPRCRRDVCGGCLDETICTNCLEELEDEARDNDDQTE